MTKESLIWKRLNLIQKKQKDWHLVRIESNTINGIPDVNACINGLEFWIELKANDAKNYGLSKYQINWHLKRHKCGGHSFILNRSLKHEAFELLEIREPGFPFPVSRFLDTESGLIKLIQEARARAALEFGSRFPFQVLDSKDLRI
jgi:hypothetical protein